MYIKNKNFVVYLKIYSFDCDPDLLEKKLKIKSSLKYKKGDFVKKTNIKRKFNGLHFESKLKSLNLNDHIKYIEEKFDDLESLKNLVKKWDVKIVCVIDIGSNNRPTLDLDKSSIEYISKINSGLWIDYYTTSG